MDLDLYLVKIVRSPRDFREGLGIKKGVSWILRLAVEESIETTKTYSIFTLMQYILRRHTQTKVKDFLSKYNYDIVIKKKNNDVSTYEVKFKCLVGSKKLVNIRPELIMRNHRAKYWLRNLGSHIHGTISLKCGLHLISEIHLL